MVNARLTETKQGFSLTLTMDFFKLVEAVLQIHSCMLS